jgi:hypothetical protein
MRNPWLELSLEAPFVLERDAAKINAYNQKADPATFVHVELLPEPFIGNPLARIVILGLNPGFSPKDAACHARPEFVALCRANLRHGASRFPFYLLNPDAEGPGNYWWKRRLRKLIDASSTEHVAQNTLCVEFFPYHSDRFNHHGLTVDSQQYSYFLVKEAIRRGTIIVLMRSKKLWFSEIPELQDYRRLYPLKNPQCAYVSPNNCSGFEAILNELCRID